MNKRILSPCYLFHWLVVTYVVLANLDAEAQEMEGLWLVQKVEVGSKNMTPNAKWFDLKAGGIYESGNGWLKNGEGTWAFDANTSELKTKETYFLDQKAPPFKVSFLSSTEALWTRNEDGMTVQVFLKKASKKPMSRMDLAYGLWKAESGELDFNLLIRWDRIYERRGNTDRKTGYWIAHAHRAEIVFLPHVAGATPETWKMEFEGLKTMTLTAISPELADSTIIFIRQH